MREVAAAHRSLVQGEPVRLPELPIQYVDYASWQRKWHPRANHARDPIEDLVPSFYQLGGVEPMNAASEGGLQRADVDGRG